MLNLAHNNSKILPVPVSGKVSIWLKCVIYSVTICMFGDYRVIRRSSDEALSTSGFDLQIKIQIILWLSLTVWALYLVIRGRVAFDFNRKNPLLWYGLYAILALISVAYTPVPKLAFFRSIQILTAIVLVSWYRPTISDMCLLLKVFVILNIIGFFVLPAAAIGFNNETNRFCTMICPAPNAMGNILCYGLAITFYKLQAYKEKKQDYIWLVLFIVMIYLTGSRTAYLAMLLIGSLQLIFNRRVQTFLVFFLLFCVLIMLSFDEVLNVITNTFIRGNVESATSLTGRTANWSEAIELWRESSIIGQGFLNTRVSQIGNMTHVDSMLFDSLLQLGVLGFLLLLISFFVLIFNAVNTILSSHKVVGYMLLNLSVPIFLYSFTGSTFSGGISLFTLIGLILMQNSLGRKTGSVRFFL